MHVASIALIAIHIVKCRAYEKSGNGNKMETGKKNGNKKCTNYWCSVFLRESLVVCFFITLVFYLTKFRWLALTHALCLILYWACHYVFCVINLVTNNESGSHVNQTHLGIRPTMRVIHLVLEKASIPTLTTSFLHLPSLSVLIACSTQSKWWLHIPRPYFT